MSTRNKNKMHSQFFSFLKLNSLSKIFLLLGITFIPTSFTHAAIVTFSDFSHLGSDSVDYIVTIEDDAEAGVTANHFKISYQVVSLGASTTEKFTGFFFDANDAYTSANLGLSNESVASCALGFNTNQVSGSGGCNSNLTLGGVAGAFQGHSWDVGIGWKNSNDLSGGQIESFEIAALSLSVNDISNIGLRGQDTNGGSAKEFQSTPNAVPVPASAWLFFSSTVALLVIRKKYH